MNVQKCKGANGTFAEYIRREGHQVHTTILEVKNITKTFLSVKALDRVNFQLEKGTVHALVGENGAGKSTLMMILGGVYKPDAGDIILEGESVSFESAYEANMKGISVVYQELSLVPHLSIAENIFAHRQPVKAFNLINWTQLQMQTRELLKKFELEHLNPRTLVSHLTIAKRQVVEILKAMSVHPKILILDEPTSSLTEVETKELFQNIRKLKQEGISIIYISHHLPEIFEIADTITVLRDGRHICDANVAEIDEDFLISNMVGRKIGNIYGQRDPGSSIGEVLFEAKNLTKAGDFEEISFSVRKGEIVGFSGLVGAGRTELGRTIFGAETVTSGEMVLHGETINITDTKHAIELGIGYLTEDRKEQGLYLEFELQDNLVANHLQDFSSNQGFLKPKEIEAFANKSVDNFNIVTPGVRQIVHNLSGGNQQKVLIAAWFGIEPQLLIVDEPTRGVDVGAKNDIYKLLRSFAAKGVGIMLISSDLPEIIGMCDRVYVMRAGRVVGELDQTQLTEEAVISLATGIYENGEENNA
jgi:ABC-type sugar transport system ATPase subunit